MATVAELEKKLEEHIHSNDIRFDKLDSKITSYQMETIKEMVKNTTLLEQMGIIVNNISTKIEVLKDKPAGQYESLKMIFTGAIVGGVITYLLSVVLK